MEMARIIDIIKTECYSQQLYNKRYKPERLLAELHVKCNIIKEYKWEKKKWIFSDNFFFIILYNFSLIL